MSMTVGRLRDIIDGLADDIEVQIQHQPHHPLKSSVGRVVLRSDCIGLDGDEEDILYISEGGQIGYGDDDAF